MSHKQKFHLAWFTNARPHGWTAQGPDMWAGRDVSEDIWASGGFLVDMAQALERACFDFIILEDHVAIEPSDIMEARLDPLMLVPLIGAATKRLGLVATMSTSFWPPYLLARMTATADHLTRGRSGWNIVTTGQDYAAQAFGLGDRQPPHDQRYERADEFTDFVKRLWDAWDPDAVIADAATGRYVDRRKVREFSFEGSFHKGLGPLNVARSPQGRPVLCQAGGSPRGRDFAAKHADVVLTSSDGANSYEVLRAFRDDIRARAISHGRDPDDVKVLMMVTPVLADTDDIAQAVFEKRYALTDARARQFSQGFSGLFGLNLSEFELDRPLPPEVLAFKTETNQTIFANFVRHAEGGRTFREMIARFRATSLDLFGTPDTVADKMEEAMSEIGGDGFLIQSRPLTRRYIAEVTEGLIPALQRRGLVRTAYRYEHFRDNLREF